jgi:hypothetical protein
MKYKMSKDAQQNADIMGGFEGMEDMVWQYLAADQIIQKAVNQCAKKKVCAAVSVNRFLTKGLTGVISVLSTVMENASEDDVKEEFFRVVGNIYDLYIEQKKEYRRSIN